MHSLQPSCLPPKGATRMHLQVSAQHDTIYYHQMGNEMILGSLQPEIWLIDLQGASWVVSGSSHSSCRAYPNMRIRYQSFWKHTCKPNCVCLASRFLAKRLKWFFFQFDEFCKPPEESWAIWAVDPWLRLKLVHGSILQDQVVGEGGWIKAHKSFKKKCGPQLPTPSGISGNVWASRAIGALLKYGIHVSGVVSSTSIYL